MPKTKLTPEQVQDRLIQELAVAELKAWDALSRYKFQMFGYWAAIWVHINRISGSQHPNPFKDLIDQARFINGSLASEQGEKLKVDA